MILFATDFDRNKRIVVDAYESVEWEPHYNEEGSFEIMLPKELADKVDYGMVIENSDDLKHQAFVTYKEYDTSEGINSNVKIQGHFLCYLMRYRYVNGLDFDTVDFDKAITDCVNTALVAPNRDYDRPFNIRYQDDSMKTVKVSFKADKTELLSCTKELCQAVDFGFTLSLEDNGDLTLYFYQGVKKPDVILSMDRNTATDVNYYNDIADVGNVFYIIGAPLESSDGEQGDNPVFKFYIGDVEPVGVDRREICVDYSGVSRKTKSGSQLNNTQYSKILFSKLLLNEEGYLGNEVMQSTIPTEKVSMYGKDFEIGDTIIQQYKRLSLLFETQITSVSQSWGEDGYEIEITTSIKSIPEHYEEVTE